MVRICWNCKENDAAGEALEKTGHCDIFDFEIRNDEPRCNCLEFVPYILYVGSSLREALMIDHMRRSTREVREGKRK